MTVDMLAAAFIWPEEMLVGRTPVGCDPDTAVADGATPADEAAAEPDAEPFWAALMRRFRTEPTMPGPEAR